jgi:transcriptional regulator with XRE-family HTH domain
MPSNDDGEPGGETVNELIKQVRLALNLPQAKFCRDIPLANGYYADIELGNRRANRRIIKLISLSYGVSERFLTTGEGEMFDSADDPKLAELVRIFRDLPPNFQDYVLHEIKELKKLRP